MSKQKYHRVECNPYEYLMLKRMIEFEVSTSLETSLTKVEIENFLKNRRTSKQYEGDANSLAENVRASIWSATDLSFKKKHVDELCRVITKLGEFESWDDFTKQMAKRQFWKQAANLVLKTYGETGGRRLDPGQIKIVSTWVERDLEIIRRRRLQEGFLERPKHNLPDPTIKHTDIVSFFPGDETPISYASKNDINRIAEFANRVYPCPINHFDTKFPWFDKNPLIFIICEDAYGELIANLNILPLKEDFFIKLKQGLVYESEIQSSDIYSDKEAGLVKHIYIEGLASTSTYALQKLRLNFRDILNGICALSDDIIICGIGGSAEGDAIMHRSGFNRTGTTRDHRTGMEYPFFEITWDRLDASITDRVKRIKK